MVNQHYFSSNPDTDFVPKHLKVRLAGAEHTVVTAPGIFSPGGIDKGTAVLLAEVPPATGKNLLDIGCGWGPIALTMALESTESQVYAVDVNTRSLQLTATNAERLGATNLHASAPEDVDATLEFDLIWSNPPIRVGKDVLHDIMRTWLPRLTVGGEAYLVVQKNLGADTLQKWLFNELGNQFIVERHTTSKGFRILRVERTA
ncbi:MULTISPECIES: class I SAM-dependent methyltransferase [unclassified Rothia (in: high G+C Gram-positive bacteria)]|uniref:class I SAM-dependent methyltransferase n=1 Tax=unclassified Rothia (in: high G+C Gram-positive bacteria) TaxID=2689056 RepID=UPI00195B7A9F|nr:MULTISPECIES: methyltransferase [unclassified Rothia (in: high G+C Gram-positive bacteria)]MBM7051281.1 methyltransferase [Rothia sp. ZJ1223]QRZ61076.1 methyltransferase [Rothia sp. ZJ932]